jgi:hypothetical protein
MRTLSAILKGNRTIQLTEDHPELSENTPVLVVITDEDDETEMRMQLRLHSEAIFARLWDNEGDKVWNEYLQTARHRPGLLSIF